MSVSRRMRAQAYTHGSSGSSSRFPLSSADTGRTTGAANVAVKRLTSSLGNIENQDLEILLHSWPGIRPASCQDRQRHELVSQASLEVTRLNKGDRTGFRRKHTATDCGNGQVKFGAGSWTTATRSERETVPSKMRSTA